MSKRTIYFRADGNGSIGFGHVIRSLALADMLRIDFELVFIAKQSSRVLEKEILQVCHHVIWIEDDLNLYLEAEFLQQKITPNSIAVIDGYNFDTAYQKEFKKMFSSLVAIDDLHQFPFVADVIVNQSGKVSLQDYKVENDLMLCSGYDYLLLRSPFLKAAQTKKRKEDNGVVFICFGGADVHNITMKSAKAALLNSRVKGIEIVVSSTYRFHEELEKLKEVSGKPMRIHMQLNENEMCELMKQCSLAIAPSSSISLELCSVGIGLVSGYYVDNQVDLYEFGLSKGVFVGVGDFCAVSEEELANSLSSNDLLDSVHAEQEKWFKGQSAANFQQLFLSLK